MSKKHWNFLFSYSFDLSAPRFEPLTSWLGVWHSPTVPRSITYLYFEICYLYKNIYTAKHEAEKFQSKKCHVTFKKQSSYSLWSCNNMKCFCFNFLTNLFYRIFISSEKILKMKQSSFNPKNVTLHLNNS